MKCAIHQPNYIPWLGYFKKMAMSDVFVFLDDVEYSKNSFINRNKIMIQDEARWLTVPVHARAGARICDTMIVPEPESHWSYKHTKTFAQYYGKSKNFKEVTYALQNLWADTDIASFNVNMNMTIAKMLGIERDFRRSSWLDKKITCLASTEKLVAICQHFKCDTYISGMGGEKYMDMDMFKKAGIKVEFCKYSETPALSAIHHLFIGDANEILFGNTVEKYLGSLLD